MKNHKKFKTSVATLLVAAAVGTMSPDGVSEVLVSHRNYPEWINFKWIPDFLKPAQGCSVSSTGEFKDITFTNKANAPITLYTVGKDCTEQTVTELPPGQSMLMSSYKGQVWRAKRSSDGTLLTQSSVRGTQPQAVTVIDPNAPQVIARDPLSAAAAAATGSPPNTPFLDALPILPVLSPSATPNPVPTADTNPIATAGHAPVEAKINGQVVASADINGFTEAVRPTHQKWTEFGGVSNTVQGFVGDFYETVEMEVPWDFYPKQDNVPSSKVWTFVDANTGTIGPVHIKAKYGTPIINRVYNALPANNGGFGINQTSTHLHNGHTASESDGGPVHFYDAGQFKDYHYANVRAGFSSNVPTSKFNGISVKGDVTETMSSLWFHDHRFDFTAQNVYKGLVSFYTLSSADINLDTDNENTGLRLPSGEYDVPMIFGDKAFDPATGQLQYDLFNIDGILGDKYTVNGKIQPYFNVAKRKYRFRLLNAGPSRYYEFFLSNGANFSQISYDGNLLPKTVSRQSIPLSVAQRSDVIVDFTNIPAGSKIYLQNRLEQTDGRGPTGKIIAPTNIIEFRVQGGVVADNSRIPNLILPLPNKSSSVPERKFDFGTSSGSWVINGEVFDPHTISIFPKLNSAEKWTFTSGGGWGHPVHSHLEEGQILSRDGKAPTGLDIGRKDIYNVGQGAIGTNGTSKMEVFLQLRDWTGDYPIHCHNVVHEDHAMMTLFEVKP